MALVGGCDPPARGDCGGGDHSIVGSDVASARGELRPDACVDASGDEIEGEGREGAQCRLDEGLASGAMTLGLRFPALIVVKRLLMQERRFAARRALAAASRRCLRRAEDSKFTTTPVSGFAARGYPRASLTGGHDAASRRG